MATKFEQSTTCPLSMAQYRQALADPAYWADLAKGHEDAPGEVVSHTVEETGVAIEMIQKIPASQLPSVVTAVISGDLVINRKMSWNYITDTHVDGTFDADVANSPANITGALSVDGADELDLSTNVAVEVKVPLIGGKIEKMIAQSLQELVTGERDHVVKWVQEKY
ncbi:DUF2505 domain-containing protein [Williamsia sp. CHRR-6]|uniref:DUF2505 domain-containing protein n=1 Tax=Williamsia sp. CHRR-6 TaxID=2835871 RepID=UPI001BDB0BAE|nr:DUF2505 domain-containing protein [Williamsia sp. CHRR-6]MBT0566928.1 DUF2505 domain-containing protein [Williamsia sp. CHRR-6]